MTKRKLIIFLSILITCCVLAGAGLALVLVEGINNLDSPLDISYKASVNMNLLNSNGTYNGVKVNNAEEFEDIYVTSGTVKASDLPRPQVADYYFGGWYYDSALTSPVISEANGGADAIIPASTTNLYPKLIRGTAWQMAYDSALGIYAIDAEYYGGYSVGQVTYVIPDYSNDHYDPDTGEYIFAPVTYIRSCSTSAIDPTYTTTVYIGYNVDTIGARFAYNCSALKYVYSYKATLGLKEDYAIQGNIYDNAFYYCNNMVTFEPIISSTSVGSYAFYNCNKVTDFRFLSVGTIGTYAFNTSSVNTQDFKDLCANNSSLRLASRSFGYCDNITEVELYNDMYYEFACFQFCDNLTKIIIDKDNVSVGSIGGFFGQSPVSTIVVESGNTKYKVDSTGNFLINTTNSTLIYGCNVAGITTITDEANRIGDMAFYNHHNFGSSISIPANYTYAGANIFAQSPVTEVNLLGGCDLCNNSTTWLKTVSNTFYNNASTTISVKFAGADRHWHYRVMLPDGITYNGKDCIDGGKMYDDYDYTSTFGRLHVDSELAGYYFDGVYLDSAFTQEVVTYDGSFSRFADANGNPFSDIILYGKYIKGSIDDSFYVYDSTLNNNKGGYTISPNDYRLENANGTTTFAIPDTVEIDGVVGKVYRIEDYAAFFDTALIPANTTVVKVGEYVNYIGNNFANECASLTSIERNAQKYGLACDTVGIDVFNGTIGKFAFANCSALSSVMLCTNVTFGASSFRNCTSITKSFWDPGYSCSDFYEFTGETVFEQYSFSNTGLTSLDFNDYFGNYYTCNQPEYMLLYRISSYAFANCANLTSVDIISRASYGESAFDNCPNLTTLEIGQHDTTLYGSIGQAFTNCTITNLALEDNESYQLRVVERYRIVDNCIIDIIDGKLIYGADVDMTGVVISADNTNSGYFSEIMAYAFYGHQNVGTSLTIDFGGGTMGTIGSYAFYDTSFTTLTFNNTPYTNLVWCDVCEYYYDITNFAYGTSWKDDDCTVLMPDEPAEHVCSS